LKIKQLNNEKRELDSKFFLGEDLISVILGI